MIYLRITDLLLVLLDFFLYLIVVALQLLNESASGSDLSLRLDLEEDYSLELFLENIH